MAAEQAAGGAARQLNRAKLVDRNFLDFVSGFEGPVREIDWPLPGSTLDPVTFLDLFESQMMSRHLDLLARELRLENKVFYTIGSAGHEGNVVLGRLCRVTDPAFLHYRSGALMMERSRKVSRIDPIYDAALSFAASSEDPAAGGRPKVWGSRPLWVPPQTSTIASHLPKAVGCALAIAHAPRIGHTLPVPEDSIVLCSFGDASINHSTAQGALNTAQWAAYQGLPVPILFVCEDNRWGISVQGRAGWVEHSIRGRPAIEYRHAPGLDLPAAYDAAKEAIAYCRARRRPVFLHLDVIRLLGHAGTDFEIEYRDESEVAATEARDPLLASARLALSCGLLGAEELRSRYEAIRERCRAAARKAELRPKLKTAAEVMAALAPYEPAAVAAEAGRSDYGEARIAAFGGEEALPENQPPRHLAVNLNRGLHDLLAKYPQALVFGEDVAQKGGVYTVTKGLMKSFTNRRVFNTLLDEQSILGMAQGLGLMDLLPVPEIQYLAYFHNACDQIRGEACSLQFFSDGRFSNPMVVRIASLGYQKGFGGHFHNDSSIAALRDIPGLIVGCPSRGDDAVRMLRTMAALARVNGRVCALLEPIALYMTRDRLESGDNEWLFAYPPPEESLALGEPRIYHPFAGDLLIVTYGNGVLMSLKVAQRLSLELGVHARVMDLRWLLPLNAEALAEHAAQCGAVLVVDEGRRSGGIGEAVLAELAERTPNRRSGRVAGKDTYTPLGPAAGSVLPGTEEIYQRARALLGGG